jgi:hypothetical protein
LVGKHCQGYRVLDKELKSAKGHVDRWVYWPCPPTTVLPISVGESLSARYFLTRFASVAVT